MKIKKFVLIVAATVSSVALAYGRTDKVEDNKSVSYSQSASGTDGVNQATTSISGSVRDAVTNEPIIAATVTLLQQNISTRTNASGEFLFSYIEPGTEEIQVSAPGYFLQLKSFNILQNNENYLGIIDLRPDLQNDAKQDIILQLNESMLDDDGSIQSGGTVFSSQSDVYLSQTGYAFSPMRFKTRGYDDKYEATYINGVRFVDAERGGFNYSSLGGLNNATRNRDLVYGLTPGTFAYGNLGANTNIVTRASTFATGSNANVAASNRSYKVRGQYTYATGVLPSGWAFAVSGVVRYANKGIVDGTFYNSAGLFLSAEKIFNEHHSLSLVAFGAPTRRAQQSAVTGEVTDLAGSIYYNPYWGYQDGEIRNSRIVHSFDPTAILSHEWKIDDRQRLRSGIAFHYAMYSNSALGFYNAPDPRPDYYRNMPSYWLDDNMKEEITQAWKHDENKRQIDWDDLYRVNRENNVDKPGTNAKYMLERRHNNLMETAFNSTYTNQISNTWRISAGVGIRSSKGIHYKTLEDMLGGDTWIDIDQFAERDFPADPDIIQNDLRNPNKVIKEGDVFGYDYNIHVFYGNVFAMSEWTFNNVDVYVGVEGRYNQFHRYGHMQNGRAPENSYGKGKVNNFTDPSAKAGFVYKIDGRNRISANVLGETRAPLVRDAYISDRIKDDLVPNLKKEKILSYDLSYDFSYPFMRGRLSGFRTHVTDGMKKVSYYDSQYSTFMHHTLSGLDKIYQGIELGISVPINSSFTVTAAGTFADYHYTSDAMGIMSYENGSQPEDEKESDRVATKNLKINSGPQLAANLTVSYFHRKMWFVDLTLNYYDNNYLDFAPNRRTASNMTKYQSYPSYVYKALGEQEKLDGGFMLDASVGKIIYLKNRQSLNFNLSLSNILNNTKMITGGYQQARIPLNSNKSINTTELSSFANKYYYAWGFNFFFHVGYKF